MQRGKDPGARDAPTAARSGGRRPLVSLGMIVIPVLDVRRGASMQPGSPRDPVSAARAWAQAGFRRLHMRDLDAVCGLPPNTMAVEEVIRDAAIEVQAEAGIESVDQIDRLIEIGAVRVVVGPRAFAEPDWLACTAELFPGALIVATDVHERRVSARGWVRSLPVDLLDVVDEFSTLPLGGLLVVVPAADGPRSMLDLALLEDVAAASDVPVMTAGGISTMSDLRALEQRGVSAALLGSALQSSALDPRTIARQFAD